MLVAFFGGAYDNSHLQAYVQKVADRIATASEHPEATYRVTALDTPIVNAFALPGGYVYITRGMLALLNDEAELAAALGHEIGHLVSHHSAERQRAALSASVLRTLLSGSAESRAQAEAESRALFARYSREQEFEADRLALHYLARAGYDPMAAVDALDAMEGESRMDLLSRPAKRKADDKAEWTTSHPATPQRIAAVKTNATGLSSSAQQERNRDAFLNAIDGMAYDYRPEQGIVLGQTFFHTRLRFSFTAPAGFRIANTPGAVVIEGPEGTAAKFDADRFSENSEGGSVSTEDYLRNIWASTAALSNIQQLQVGGLPALSADAHINDYNVRLVAIRVSPDLVYRFLMGTKPATGERYISSLQALVKSFHIMSGREASSVRTRRVHIVTITKGDTVASLAARMKVRDFPRERLRMLNGLKPDETLKAGQRIKLIEE